MAEQVQRKAVIKNADMSEEMQQSAVDVASHALSKYNIEKVSQVIDAFFLAFTCFSVPAWRKFGKPGQLISDILGRGICM